jgi:hypothetical protein
VKTEEELFLTLPLSASEADMAAVRGILIDAISRVDSILKTTRSEKVACLNIDWFRF